MPHTRTNFPKSISKIPEAPVCISYLHRLCDKCEEIFKRHREENPDLYRLIDLRKKQATMREKLLPASGKSAYIVTNSAAKKNL